MGFLMGMGGGGGGSYTPPPAAAPAPQAAGVPDKIATPLDSELDARKKKKTNNLLTTSTDLTDGSGKSTLLGS